MACGRMAFAVAKPYTATVLAKPCTASLIYSTTSSPHLEVMPRILLPHLGVQIRLRKGHHAYYYSLLGYLEELFDTNFDEFTRFSNNFQSKHSHWYEWSIPPASKSGAIASNASSRFACSAAGAASSVNTYSIVQILFQIWLKSSLAIMFGIWKRMRNSFMK